jgi:hypothetical protein
MPKLIPALTGGKKRMAGYWMLYRNRRSWWNPERGEEIFLARCAKRMGNELQTDGYDRVALHRVWLLDGSVPIDAHWPKDDLGLFKSLTPADVKAILDELNVEVGSA